MSALKKARKFSDYSVGELHELVKSSSALEELLQAKEAQVAALEEQLDQSEEELFMLKDYARQAERVKVSISKQFISQMVPERDLGDKEREKLKSKGREISVLIPNVNTEILAHLGLMDKLDEKGQPRTRRVDHFLGSRMSKGIVGGGVLQLQWRMDFKYIRTSCELKATAVYKQVNKSTQKTNTTSARSIVVSGSGGGCGGSSLPIAAIMDEENLSDKDLEDIEEDMSSKAKPPVRVASTAAAEKRWVTSSMVAFGESQNVVPYYCE